MIILNHFQSHDIATSLDSFYPEKKFLKNVESLFINIVVQCIRCCNALGWELCPLCLLNKTIL